MIIIPTSNMPYYQVEIYVFIEDLVDGRGVARARTSKLAHQLGSSTVEEIKRYCYGAKYGMVPFLDVGFSARTDGGGRSLTITAAVPLDTNIDGMARTLRCHWLEQYEIRPDALMRAERYAVDELDEDYYS